ncbi:MAG: replication initiator protein A [Paracoccaceae bacterium]|nr:replication initiator protein A [Paracoccaceae bacterium]
MFGKNNAVAGFQSNFLKGHPLPRTLYMVDIQDVQLKETIPHLEHPFFTLTKNPNPKIYKRRYVHGQNYLEIQGSADHGLPTIFDQDIIIYAVSMLMAERLHLARNPTAQGRRRTEEGMVYFSTADFCQFARRVRVDEKGKKIGGHNYDLVEKALWRLVRTTITTNIVKDSTRLTEGFAFIPQGGILRRENRTSTLSACRLRLNTWMMEAIDKGQTLDLHPDYFSLRRPFDRRMYQIFRKHVGRQKITWPISLENLYNKSGATEPLRKFRFRFKEFVARWDQELLENGHSFLDYQPTYIPGRDLVQVTYFPDEFHQLVQTNLHPLGDNAWKYLPIVAEEFQTTDPQPIYEEYLQHVSRLRVPIKNHTLHLREWVKHREIPSTTSHSPSSPTNPEHRFAQARIQSLMDDGDETRTAAIEELPPLPLLREVEEKTKTFEDPEKHIQKKRAKAQARLIELYGEEIVMDSDFDEDPELFLKFKTGEISQKEYFGPEPPNPTNWLANLWWQELDPGDQEKYRREYDPGKHFKDEGWLADHVMWIEYGKTIPPGPSTADMPDALMEALAKYHKLPHKVMVPLAFENWRQGWEDAKALGLAGSPLYYLTEDWHPKAVLAEDS